MDIILKVGVNSVTGSQSFHLLKFEDVRIKAKEGKFSFIKKAFIFWILCSVCNALLQYSNCNFESIREFKGFWTRRTYSMTCFVFKSKFNCSKIISPISVGTETGGCVY